MKGRIAVGMGKMDKTEEQVHQQVTPRGQAFDSLKSVSLRLRGERSSCRG